MLNRYRYSAIFIKDFLYISFISIFLKDIQVLTNFIGEQFKRLPKNRRQMKLLFFIQQALKIFCKQRKEVTGLKFQIKGRLNRRNRTHVWKFQKGILSIQSFKTRIEYAYSEGFTKRGLIGIKLWIIYNKTFQNLLKKKLTQYLFYSKYKNNFILQNKLYQNQQFNLRREKQVSRNKLKFQKILNQIDNHAKTKTKKISKK